MKNGQIEFSIEKDAFHGVELYFTSFPHKERGVLRFEYNGYRMWSMAHPAWHEGSIERDTMGLALPGKNMRLDDTIIRIPHKHFGRVTEMILQYNIKSEQARIAELVRPDYVLDPDVEAKLKAVERQAIAQLTDNQLLESIPGVRITRIHDEVLIELPGLRPLTEVLK